MRGVQTARGTPLNPPGKPRRVPTRRPSPPPPHPASGVRPRRVPVLLGVAILIIAADITSKSIVLAKLTNHPPIRLLDGFLTLTLLRNPGAAFNVGTSMTIAFTVIATSVVVYILRTARNLRSTGWAITLGLLLGGATGNLIDRIFRSPGAFRGAVIDGSRIPHWPVFNVADSAIVCGGIRSACSPCAASASMAPGRPGTGDRGG